MSDHDEPIVLREIEPHEVTLGGALHAPFVHLHREWVARGVARWLRLIGPDGPHPVVIIGAFVRGRLTGAVVGVWAASPVERFDRLLATELGRRADERPDGGAWHLIAVTTDPAADVRGLGLGRALLGWVLTWARELGHAEVRTLSPTLGLPALAALWPRGLGDAVARSSRVDGRPALQVMRLHLGGGAVLERVLPQSRTDDDASGGVTLRFVYSTDPIARAAQRARFGAWCAERERLIAEGRAERVAADLYRVVTRDDDAFVSG